MHWIKKYILEQLLYINSLRNRDMRPPKVESNLYQYHLKQLIKDDWIVKTNNKYTLAAKGLAWADHYSGDLRNKRDQSKVVSIILLKNEKNEYLLMPRKRQPFVGQLTFISGKVKKGESAPQAASRELLEKTGVNGISLQQSTTVRSIITLKDKVVTDYIGFTWIGSISKLTILPKEYIWMSKKEICGHESVLEGVPNIFRSIKKQSHYVEIKQDIAL